MIAALPPDGPRDPKILMRVHRDHDLHSISAAFTYDGGHFSQVDWGTGEPLLPDHAGGGAEPAAEEHAPADEPADEPSEGAAGGSRFLKRAIVKRAGSLAAPQKKLKRGMAGGGVAPLTGPTRHFINEVEIHPGYYVDWDETPDLTIDPLAHAYGEYATQLLADRREASRA